MGFDTHALWLHHVWSGYVTSHQLRVSMFKKDLEDESKSQYPVTGFNTNQNKETCKTNKKTVLFLNVDI